MSVIEVTVKFFGSYQEEVGEEEVQVRLGDGETVADLLGHRSLESTAIYAKVDEGRLREAALEWPEVL